MGVQEFFHSPEAACYGPLPPQSYITLYHVQLINSTVITIYIYNMDLYDLVELGDIAYNEFILLAQSKLFNSHVYFKQCIL